MFYLAHIIIVLIALSLYFVIRRDWWMKIRSLDFLVYLVFLSLTFRIVGALFFHYVLFSEFETAFQMGNWGDDIDYHNLATKYSKAWHLGIYPPSSHLPLSYLGYPIFLAVLYYAFGSSPYVGILFNCLIGILTCLLVYRVGTYTVGEEKGRLGALLLSIFPMHIYYCSLLLKDVLLSFLFLLIVYIALQIKDKKMPVVNSFILLLPLTMMMFIRVPAFLLSAMILVAFFFLNARKVLLYIPISLIIGGVITWIYMNVVTHNLGYYVYDSSLREYYLSQIYAMMSLRGFYDSIILWILLPFGFILPLPTWAAFDIGNDITWLTTSSIFCWNLVVIYVLVGILISLYNRFHQSFLVYVPVLGFYLGTSLIYISTILDDRRKVMILPFAMLLAAVGMTEWKHKLSGPICALYFVAITFAGIFYTYLRMSARGLW